MNTVEIKRVLAQVEQNLLGLRRDMRNNASAWKSAAQTVPLSTLRQWIADAAAQYLRRLDWRVDEVTWQRVKSLHSAQGGDGADFGALAAPLKIAASALADADTSTPEGIVAACDAVLSSVQAPQSLWPE